MEGILCAHIYEAHMQPSARRWLRAAADAVEVGEPEFEIHTATTGN
jgi:hypothetical protein